MPPPGAPSPTNQGYPPQAPQPHAPHAQGQPLVFATPVTRARPPLATAAAIIWTALGGLGALIGLWSTITGNVFAVFLVIFSLGFVLVGVQTLRGTARDTLGNAVGSLLFGLCAFGYSIWSLLPLFMLAAAFGALGAGVLILMFGMLQGLALLAAGIMALVARADYLAWVKSKSP
jgi:hypothetical protein